MPRTIPFLFLMMLAAGPAAAWTLDKRQDWVIAREVDGGYTIEIICRRGKDWLEFNYLANNLRAVDPTGAPFTEIPSMMLWVKLPDGRTDRWPVDVVPEGPNMNGQIVFNDQNLDFFRNAESLEITVSAPHRETIFRSDMKGSGAARVAFQDRCGI